MAPTRTSTQRAPVSRLEDDAATRPPLPAAKQRRHRVAPAARGALTPAENSPRSVAECLEFVLAANGISLMATIPGGPLMPFLKVVHDAGRLRPILTRHEAGAAMLAEGYARISGDPALVAVTAGPGVSNAATGVALAYQEQTPLVLLSAQVPNAWNGRGAAQELDTVRLLEPITKASVTLSCSERAPALLDQLIRLAKSGRPGPVHLSVPANLWNRRCDSPWHGSAPPLGGTAVGTREVDAFVRLLDEAERPCFLVGRGVSQARAESALLEVAARCPRLRIACTPRSKGTFPEDHPQSVGVFGFGGHDSAERALLDESDVLFVLGSRLGEITSLNWDARFCCRTLVQVDREPTELGKNFPIALGITSDLHALLHAVAQRLPAGAKPSGVAQPERIGASQPRTVGSATPRTVHPTDLMQVLNANLKGHQHVFVDIGNTMAWAIHHLKRSIARRWHINLTYGCMGHAIPAAIGGALASREPVLALVGDAAFAMSGMELHTAAELRLPLIVVVLNDAGHGMVEFGATHQWGRDQVPSMRFAQPIDGCALADSLGVAATSVDDVGQLGVALRRALATNGPTLLDVHIDPSALPPFGSRMKALEQNFCPDDEVNT